MAFRKALARLNQDSTVCVCARTGARQDERRIAVCYFERVYTIQLPDAAFEPPDIKLADKILILHYLTGKGKRAVKGELVTFKDLPSGAFYDYAYQKRGPARILRRFGQDPEQLLIAAVDLGGTKATFGDVSVHFSILPKIDACVVLHRGDSEFLPTANILYRDSVINFLDLEDVAFLGGRIADKLS